MTTTDPILDDPRSEADAPVTADPAESAEAEAALDVTVSPDGLVATLVLPPLRNASAPDLGALVDVLESEHGLVDVDADRLEFGIEQARGSESQPVTIVVAEGEEPVDGEDGSIEWLGDFFESHAIHLPNGAVDHYHHTRVSVRAGQPLVRLHPPTTGCPGRTVRGESIEAKPGVAASLEHDETVRPDERDPSVLVSTRAGLVESCRGTITVSELQVVESVDFSTGSIDFEGAVHVRDSVAAKFSVVGTGAVIIGGPVENARIESRKNITIEKGVLGKGEAQVICAGDLSIGFARETSIQVGGRLVARRELLWCDGEVHDDLLVEAGRIVGGHWRCGGRIVVDEIGSREEVTTFLTLGEAPGQNRALEVLTRDRKKHQEQLADFRRKYGPILRGEVGRLGAEERAKIEQRCRLYERQARRARKREFVLRKRVGIQRHRSFVWAKTMIFAGTRVGLNGGRLVHEVKEDQPGPVCIRYDARTRTAVVEHLALTDCARKFT